MPKYIAFLRAINVGGHQVKMDHLRQLFEELGFTNVETFIASGNVIFDSKSTAKILTGKIEKHLHKSLGYEVKTFLRSVAELAAVAEYKPFSRDELEVDTHTLYIGFLPEAPPQDSINNLMAKSSAIDAFHINNRELYWLYRREHGESKFYGSLLEKSIGMTATLRNVNTVDRLVKKYHGK